MPVPQGSTQTDAQAWAKIKPYATKAIKDAILAANTSGITVTLPPNVAFTNVEQTFIARQYVLVSSNSIGSDVVSSIMGTIDINTLPSNSPAPFYGGYFGAVMNDASFDVTGSITGSLSYFELKTTRTLDEGYGLISSGTLSAAGTITDSAGLRAMMFATAAGTLSNHRGLWVDDISNTGGATVTKIAGAVIADQTGTAASNLVLGAITAPAGTYSIYNASARDNYFAGGIGIGAFVAATDAKVYIANTSTITSSVNYDLRLLSTANPAGASSAVYTGQLVRMQYTSNQNLTGELIGFQSESYANGSGTFNRLRAGVFFAYNAAAGTVDTGFGVMGIASNTGSGTYTNAIGLNGRVENLSNGTVTNGYGIQLSTFVNSGGGTFTNAVGIAMADMAVGTNKTNVLLGTTTIPAGTWNIYAPSTLNNYIAGTVTLAKDLIIANALQAPLDFQNTRAGGFQFTLRTRPAANSQIGDAVDYAYNILSSTGVERQAAVFRMIVVDPTNASEDVRFDFYTMAAGALTLPLTLTDKVGVNNSGPVARLHVTESTLGNEVARIESTATNDDPRVSWFQNRAATTDNTQTTIATVAIPATTTVMLEAHITARRTGGVAGTAEDGAAYVVRGCYKNVAGTATLIGAVNADYTAESQAGWDATFTVSGGNALIRVTGATNNNVTWHVTYNYYPVGS